MDEEEMCYETAVSNLRYIFTKFPNLRLVERVSPGADERNGLALKIETRSKPE